MPRKNDEPDLKLAPAKCCRCDAQAVVYYDDKNPLPYCGRCLQKIRVKIMAAYTEPVKMSMNHPVVKAQQLYSQMYDNMPSSVSTAEKHQCAKNCSLLAIDYVLEVLHKKDLATEYYDAIRLATKKI